VKRVRVKSASITSIGYDLAARVLEIEFRPGEVYQYLPVPLHVFEELMAAESKGAYVESKIKGHFIYRAAS
jgi:hypothetical protein